MRPIHEMQPTMKLRFVDRDELNVTDGHNYLLRVKILQQQFASVLTPDTFEWRDVPLEVV